MTASEFRSTKPTIGLVGPMLGRNAGWVTSQGEVLAHLFREAGYSVKITSTFPNRTLRLIDTIRALLQWRNDVEIIILMVFSGRGFVMADISSRLAQLTQTPIVLWLHGGNLPTFSKRYPRWVRHVFQRGDAVVSPSAYLASHFQKWGHTLRIIPNVLKIDRYPFRKRKRLRPQLLWMRTFQDLYHPEMAVEVLAALQRAHSTATLTMAGQDKGLLPIVKSLVMRKGLQNHVRFPGFLDMSAKQLEFNRHDIFLNTNRVDNMPISVIEAAAFGLPIISTAVGGIPYLLTHEQTALLINNEDIGGMTAAVNRLLVDPVLAHRLSEGGRQLAEQCSWPAVRSQWEQLFKRVLHDGS